MAYEVILNRADVHRILLEPRVEGVYVNVFRPPGHPDGDRDDLQSDLEMAMRSCLRLYGVSPDAWRVVPNEPLHFDSTEDQTPQFPGGPPDPTAREDPHAEIRGVSLAALLVKLTTSEAHELVDRLAASIEQQLQSSGATPVQLNELVDESLVQEEQREEQRGRES